MSDSSKDDALKSATDAIVIYDRSSRRRFIRTGAAFLLTGAAVAASRPTLAADCDQGGTPNENKQAGNGSDSDAGEGADAPGCGRRTDKPKITRLRDTQDSSVKVARSVKLTTVSG